MSKCEVEYTHKLKVWQALRKGARSDTRQGIFSWEREWEVDFEVKYKFLLSIERPIMRVQYTQEHEDCNETMVYDYTISLDKTPCYFGGYRYWFLCPLRGIRCDKRVGVLYLRNGSFGCRSCHGLTYFTRKLNSVIRHCSEYKGEKAERLLNKIHRSSWGGRPTRKQKMLNKLSLAKQMK